MQPHREVSGDGSPQLTLQTVSPAGALGQMQFVKGVRGIIAMMVKEGDSGRRIGDKEKGEVGSYSSKMSWATR